MARAAKVTNERADARLQASARLLESLSFNQVLARGYAIVKDADGKVISRSQNVTEGMPAQIQFVDGTNDAVFTSPESGGVKLLKPKKSIQKKQADKAEKPTQGSLL